MDAVHGALQLSVHVLSRDPKQLAGQLVGRLLGRSEPSISALVDAAHPFDGHPWLCPRTPGSLTEPGGPLERILDGHTGSVHAVAVTADGQRVVSGGDDRTVRVWDLASGTELAYWVTDTARVLSCASHPRDPATLVDGDGDGRVVVLSLRESHSAIRTST